MKRVCIYPGSFDPITNGHLNLIERTAGLFDEMIVAVLHNPSKKGLFSVRERVALIEQCCGAFDNVRADSFEGLLVEYVKQYENPVLLRGIRDYTDYANEIKMANLNARLCPGLETLFLPAKPELIAVSSSAVKEILSFDGNINDLVPQPVERALRARLSK